MKESRPFAVHTLSIGYRPSPVNLFPCTGPKYRLDSLHPTAYPQGMKVLTYTLCRQHDTYYLHACPVCYLADMRRVEAYTRHPEPIDVRGLAYLRATSTTLPPCP